MPAFLVAMGYKELNKADPDCGTTFTWATRAFGPRTGWMGGWGIVVADVLVMASLAQVAGQYVFLLFNANGIGENATSGWVLTVGVAFIVLMTWICYRGIELSARIQTGLLGARSHHARGDVCRGARQVRRGQGAGRTPAAPSGPGSTPPTSARSRRSSTRCS